MQRYDAGDEADRASGEWKTYGGDPGAMKFSPLAQITRDNVHLLRPVWEWRTGERPDSVSHAHPGLFEATPLMIGDTLFLSTPYNQVVALDGPTGRELWRYDPKAYAAGQPPNGMGFVHRGVASWSDGKSRRIFLNSRWRLIALDAATGTADSFVWKRRRNRPHLRPDPSRQSPPLHQYLSAGRLAEPGHPGQWRSRPANLSGDPPGDVQAFDVRTGQRVWRWSPIPRDGEYGVDTWETGAWKRVGHTNVWAPFTVDTARGMVFLPVSTPSNDYYGGARTGNNLFAESIVALDAATGRRLWHFQTVHHGLWDYDPPAPPLLATVQRNGKTADLVAMPGKTGFLYVFDRVSGKPVWPIEERSVTASDVPGEHAAATQPVPTWPKPFSRQGITEADLLDFTPELKAMALAAVTGHRLGGLFTPPSLEGTVALPGVIGGSGWGGGAFDPLTGIFYVKANNSPALLQLAHPIRSAINDAEYSIARCGARHQLVARRPRRARSRGHRPHHQAALRHADRDRPGQRSAALAGHHGRLAPHPEPSTVQGTESSSRRCRRLAGADGHRGRSWSSSPAEMQCCTRLTPAPAGCCGRESSVASAIQCR